MREFLCENTDQKLDGIARELWSLFENKTILFIGDLGAGKTTLIKSLLKQKNDAVLASSPSFSLINEYPFDGGKIVHMDLYRLNDIQEALDIGVDDYLSNNDWKFIEWPQLIKPLLDEDHHLIEIEILDSCTRKIIFRQ